MFIQGVRWSWVARAGVSGDAAGHLLLLFAVLLFVYPTVPILTRRKGVGMTSFRHVRDSVATHIATPGQSRGNRIYTLVHVIAGMGSLVFRPSTLKVATHRGGAKRV